MPEKRRWRRVQPLSPALRVGKIFLGPEHPMIDCNVIDLSTGGACLELLRHYDLPNKFELLHGKTLSVCYLAWRRGFRLGVSYEPAYQKEGIRGGLARAETTSTSWLSRPRR
jgi:hypothetical protein